VSTHSSRPGSWTSTSSPEPVSSLAVVEQDVTRRPKDEAISLRVYVALALVLLAVAGWFTREGPRVAPDSSRYLNGAQELREKGTITGKATRYSGYVVVVMLAGLVADSPEAQLRNIVAMQIAVLVFALVCLCRLGAELSGPRVGWIAGLLFASNAYLLRWTPYVLPATMFTSFVVIACWLCVRSARKATYLPAAIAAVIVTTTLRPNGIALLPVFVLYLMSTRDRRTRWLAAGLLGVVLVLSIPVVRSVLDGSAEYESLVERMKVGTVIWSEDPVDQVEIEGRTGSQLLDLARFIAANPAHSAGVMARRLFRAYSFQRDDYSWRHRLFLAVLMPILLGLALTGLIVTIRSSGAPHYMLAVGLVAAQSAVIAISFADHDHRFISYVMPLIFLFVAKGLTSIGPGSRLEPTEVELPTD